jgi:predicted transcriptional regulator
MFCAGEFASEPKMSMTTIRMTDDLKARVATAATRDGKTTHGFILEAIVEKLELSEHRAEFQAVADQRYARLVASGKTIPWEKIHGYLEPRLSIRPFCMSVIVSV